MPPPYRATIQTKVPLSIPMRVDAKDEDGGRPSVKKPSHAAFRWPAISNQEEMEVRVLNGLKPALSPPHRSTNKYEYREKEAVSRPMSKQRDVRRTADPCAEVDTRYCCRRECSSVTRCDCRCRTKRVRERKQPRPPLGLSSHRLRCLEDPLSC